jgi:hypothetical protein
MWLWRWARSAASAGRARLVAAIEAVLAGHKSDGMPSLFCLLDGFSWPCPTCRAIARALDGEQ